MVFGWNLFGSSFTAEEVTRDARLQGKLVIITGANTGIGKETAKILFLRGAHVILASRNQKLNTEAIQDIQDELSMHYDPSTFGQLEGLSLDLSSFENIKSFASDFLARNVPLHILILNAGIMAPMEKGTTAEGFEMQWGVNHLGHFLLTQLLMPALIAAAQSSSSKDDLKPRVISLSSRAHTSGHINFEDPNFERRPYLPFKAYGNSKLANLLFARELHKRIKAKGVIAVSVHPGVIQTELTRNNSKLQWIYKAMYPFLKSIPQGASTTCYCAVRNDLEGGAYYVDCAPYPPGIPEATDDRVAAKLWGYSMKAVGLSDGSDDGGSSSSSSPSPVSSKL